MQSLVCNDEVVVGNKGLRMGIVASNDEPCATEEDPNTEFGDETIGEEVFSNDYFVEKDQVFHVLKYSIEIYKNKGCDYDQSRLRMEMHQVSFHHIDFPTSMFLDSANIGKVSRRFVLVGSPRS